MAQVRRDAHAELEKVAALGEVANLEGQRLGQDDDHWRGPWAIGATLYHAESTICITLSRLRIFQDVDSEAFFSQNHGADYPNRTDDLPLTRRMLYQLS